MKRIIAAFVGIFVVLLMVNCARPKPAIDARIQGIKAKLYDVETNIRKMEAGLDRRAGATKAVKEARAAMKKAVESDRRELREIQEKLERFGYSSGAAMDEFILSVELSADILAKKSGRAIDGLDENRGEYERGGDQAYNVRFSGKTLH